MSDFSKISFIAELINFLIFSFRFVINIELKCKGINKRIDLKAEYPGINLVFNSINSLEQIPNLEIKNKITQFV